MPEIGRELVEAMRAQLDAIPGSPHRPTHLARQLGLSRVILSRLLGAVDCEDPFEALERIPGPDSLRAFVDAALDRAETPAPIAERAHLAIDRFAELIRDDFGTRSALSAALSARSPELQQRLVQGARYQVYQGMRQILGVEADAWLTSMMFAPSRENPEMLEVISIHGPIGMRRLRSDVGVHFTFGEPGKVGGEDALSSDPLDLSEFYEHEAARIQTHVAGGQLVHSLADDRVGRNSAVDMLALSRNAQGSRRYATPERPRGGAVVFPDVPVKTLVCDVLVHEGAFTDEPPELLVFNPGARGPANPVDPSRSIDRVSVPETVESLGRGLGRADFPELPRYTEMVARVCDRYGLDHEQVRVHRLRMSYPVHGFQFVMAFNALAPEGE
ncbi:MAG: hypothetical protein ACIARR_04265 [Phycisphaerales bacterium JB059]